MRQLPIIFGFLIFSTASAYAQTCVTANGKPVCQMITNQNDLTIRPLQGSSYYGPTDSTKANISWWVGQWGIPSQLPVFNYNKGGYWTSGTSSATVQVTLGQSGFYYLQQSGASLPCYSQANNIGGEFDLYINSMGTDGPPSGYSLGILTNWAGSRNTSLANMLQTEVTAVVEGDTLQVSNRAGGNCSDQGSVDQYNILFAITMNDTKSGQAMFYQASLGTGAIQNDKIVSTTASPQFFEVNNSNVWGFDDPSSVNIPAPMPFDFSSHTYTFDILPRLKYAIAHDPSGKLDQNLSNWNITSVYTGQAIWGNLLLTTGWHQLGVAVTFPS